MEKRKLVTIITEAIIETLITEDVKRLGAHGYTITDARGEGSRGVRRADWTESSNVRIEVVCDETTSQSITAHLSEKYYTNYAMVVFVTDVCVMRPGKF